MQLEVAKNVSANHMSEMFSKKCKFFESITNKFIFWFGHHSWLNNSIRLEKNIYLNIFPTDWVNDWNKLECIF